MVSKLMEVERQPIKSMRARKLSLETKKAAWSDIRTRMQNLNDRLADLKLDSVFGAKATSSGNTSVVTAAADSSALTGSYSINVTNIAKAHVISSDVQASSTAALNLTGSFTLNGVTVNVASTDSLNVIRDSINAANAGVMASVVDNKLILKSNNTGTANAITVEADPNDILGTLGVVNAGTTTIKNELQPAADASFSVDGLNLTRSTNSVSDVISGVTLQLNGAGSTTLQVVNDSQVAIDKIKAFVDQYNSVMDLIHQKLGKKGDLQGDPTLARLERRLREHVSGTVSGLTDNYNSLSDIGITTQGTANGGSLSGSLSGKLIVDEAKLRAALEANPAGVKDIFYSASVSVNGITEVLGGDVDLYATGSDAVITSQESGLSKRMTDLDNQIKRLEDLLDKRERTLLNRFAAADSMLMRLQQQSSSLASFMNLNSK